MIYVESGTHDVMFSNLNIIPAAQVGIAPGSTCELTLADASYLAEGTTLDPKGKYIINGGPTEDMIVVPTDLIYNDQAQELDGRSTLTTLKPAPQSISVRPLP